MDLAPGVLLVAEPAMIDPNFRRAVILLCEHSDEGSFGLIVNKPTDLHLPEVLTEPLGLENQLFLGGPVQPDTLHFLHSYPEEIPEAQPILNGVAWGGPLEEVTEGIRLGMFDAERFRFFAGYAGWGGGQLEGEIEERSWVVMEADPRHIFDAPPAQLWRRLILGLGGEMALLANYPDEPRLN